MSDREAFVSAIAAKPDDDLPRLVFADWLEENGDPERAEFIRTQIRWHHAFPDEREELDRTAFKLFREHGHRWFGPFVAALEPEFPSELWGDVQHADHPAARIPLPNMPSTYPFQNRHPPKLSIISFQISGGFVSDLTVAVRGWQEQFSLAEAFRHEPVCQLECGGGLQSHQWTQFTNPCLRRVTELTLWERWT